MCVAAELRTAAFVGRHAVPQEPVCRQAQRERRVMFHAAVLERRAGRRDTAAAAAAAWFGR